MILLYECVFFVNSVSKEILSPNLKGFYKGFTGDQLLVQDSLRAS